MQIVVLAVRSRHAVGAVIPTRVRAPSPHVNNFCLELVQSAEIAIMEPASKWCSSSIPMRIQVFTCLLLLLQMRHMQMSSWSWWVGMLYAGRLRWISHPFL